MWRAGKPRRRIELELIPGERWEFFGMTGFGKSQFAKYLDRAWFNAGAKEAYWPILIFDQDHGWFKGTDYDYAKKPELATVEQPWDITKTGVLHETARVQIFHPAMPGWRDERFLSLCEQCLARGNMVLHFDELYGLVDANHIPQEVGKLWTSGRKFGITIHAISQRPADLPMVIITQSEHKIAFYIEGPADRARIAELFADKAVYEEIARLEKYWHLYKKTGVPGWVKVGPLPQSEVR